MSKLQTALFGLAKFAVLFTTAVYILSLPYYWVIIAQPSGHVDMLLPYEAVLCLFLSALMFAWSCKTAVNILKSVAL